MGFPQIKNQDSAKSPEETGDMTESPGIVNFHYSRRLQKRAHQLIPAGCHTYSKGDDQFPLNAPGFIERASGCYCWDVDGNEFLDWGMGLRSVILGHAYPRVLEAARTWLEKGVSFTRPSSIELELAEALVGLIPSAEMVKFAKNGSDVTSAAIRLARAYTGRDCIARCREHPFFSFYDWFIGSTPCHAGIPREVQELTLQFSYNDIASLEALFEQFPDQVAAVIMEPVITDPPANGFLERLRDLTHQHGAVLIFDEIITGFRWHLQGAQTYFGVIPDLSTFGKALGNGFSVSALAGRRDIMELGGIMHDKERVFLLSATHGGETHALAATLATLAEIHEKQVVEHIWRIGNSLQEAFNLAAQYHGIQEMVSMEGYPCSPHIVCRDQNGEISLPFRTLFLQEMISQGVLIPYIAPSYSHTEYEVELTVRTAKRAFEIYTRALDQGSVADFLEGPAAKPVFRKYN